MDCPYCAMALKKGELFCSRHATDMASLKSGIFLIRSNRLEECDWHTTRLSLNFNTSGEQHYFTPARSYRVSPQRYLLLNEGQMFKTCLESDHENNMLTVAFRVGLPDIIYQTHRRSQETLLDNPHGAAMPTIDFFEKTYAMDSFLHASVQALTNTVYRVGQDEEAMEGLLENMLTHVLILQGDIHQRYSMLKMAKVSTQKEIYKRLIWATEFIQGNFERNITVEQVAAEACLSPYYFKRLFKEVFNQSPYQYIKNIRLSKAKELLLCKALPVHEICKAVGWEDASSFIRLFKKETRVTPQQWMAMQAV
jgi:AraC family transcriptional regulator